MCSYFSFALLDRNYFQLFEYLTSLFYNMTLPEAINWQGWRHWQFLYCTKSNSHGFCAQTLTVSASLRHWETCSWRTFYWCVSVTPVDVSKFTLVNLGLATFYLSRFDFYFTQVEFSVTTSNQVVFFDWLLLLLLKYFLNNFLQHWMTVTMVKRQCTH